MLMSSVQALWARVTRQSSPYFVRLYTVLKPHLAYLMLLQPVMKPLASL